MPKSRVGHLSLFRREHPGLMRELTLILGYRLLAETWGRVAGHRRTSRAARSLRSAPGSSCADRQVETRGVARIAGQNRALVRYRVNADQHCRGGGVLREAAGV